jgi:hypothetical protein
MGHRVLGTFPAIELSKREASEELRSGELPVEPEPTVRCNPRTEIRR